MVWLLFLGALPEAFAPLVGEGRIALDGRGVEPAWAEAPPLKGFTLIGPGGPAPQATEAKVLCSRRSLYFLLVCEDEEILAQRRPKDGPVWADDSVEIFLNPGLSEEEYRHFIVNAAGSLYDALGQDSLWEANWGAKVSRAEWGWSVEVEIPFSSLGLRPESLEGAWRLNICRNHKPEGLHSSWSPLPEPSFHLPPYFGVLSLPSGIDLRPFVKGGGERGPKVVVLADFERGEEVRALIPSLVKVERAKEHRSHGMWALKAFFPGSEKETWPGFWVEPSVKDWSGFYALQVDVYNPEPRRVRLSIRVDDEEGRVWFGGEWLSPRSRGTAQFAVGEMGVSVNARRIRRFYLYLSRPREETTLYFDFMRLVPFEEVFREVVYVDQSPMPPLPPEDKRRGYVLFRRHYLRLVMPNSIPRKEEMEAARKVEVFAAPGEYEPFTLSVKALRDLKGVSVKVSSLSGPKGGQFLRGPSR